VKTFRTDEAYPDLQTVAALVVNTAPGVAYGSGIDHPPVTMRACAVAALASVAPKEPTQPAATKAEARNVPHASRFKPTPSPAARSGTRAIT
jgi:hypothetical protein